MVAPSKKRHRFEAVACAEDVSNLRTAID